MTAATEDGMNGRRRRRCGNAALCILLAACGGGGSGGPGFARVDGAPLAVDPEPRIVIGNAPDEPEHELFRVVTPFLMPDGRLVVPVAAAATLRVFAPDGTYLRSLGREGRGPGEFVQLAAAWPRGDTIEALDWRLRRITRFLPDDSVETVTLVTDLPDLYYVGPVENGWIVGGVAEGGTGRRDRVAAHHIDRNGVDYGEIASLQGMARYSSPRLVGPEPLSARAFFVVTGERLYAAESTTAAVHVVNAAGQIEEEITFDPGPPGDVDAALRHVVDVAVERAGPARAESVRQHLEAAPPVERLPLFGGLLVDDEGFLWIRPYDPDRHAFALGGRTGGGGTWTILAPDGRPTGTVDLPADLDPMAITTDAVVGIARDAFDVEMVRVHTLRRR